MPVPLFDTAATLAPLRAEIDAAIARVIDSGRFILGPQGAAFETEFADYCGARHAIGGADGTYPAWHLYVVRSARADELAAALKAAGHGQKAYYRTPVHLQPAMSRYAQ